MSKNKKAPGNRRKPSGGSRLCPKGKRLLRPQGTPIMHCTEASLSTSSVPYAKVYSAELVMQFQRQPPIFDLLQLMSIMGAIPSIDWGDLTPIPTREERMRKAAANRLRKLADKLDPPEDGKDYKVYDEWGE